MLTSRCLNRWLAAVLVLATGPVSAEPDDLKQAWLDRMTVSHRWDNVEGTPAYVRGVRPRYVHAEGLHVVRLDPGEQITLRVADGESVRARGVDKSLRASDLHFAWSNGSGLSVKALPFVRSGGESLVSTAPGGETLLSVTRPREHGTAVEIALFVSRRLQGLVTSQYRDLLRPVEAGPAVQLLDSEGVTEYWSSDLHRPLTVSVEGPVRIEVRTRLMMSPGDRSIEPYRAYAYLDDEFLRVLNFETALETRRLTPIKACVGPMGRVARAYVDAPAGKHRVQLRFRRPVLTRLVAGERPDDYLFDGNRPDGIFGTTAGAAGESTETPFWAAGGEARVEDQQASASSALAYRSALRVAENNGYRDGGLVGAMALKGRWPGVPASVSMRSMVSRRLSLHTHYRDLKPESGGGAGVYAWFEPTRLRRSPQEPPLVPQSLAPSLIRDLPRGYFTPVPAESAGGLRYSLPKRSAPSSLRVAVQRSPDALGATLHVQLDRREPFELRLHEPALQGASEYLPSTPATALALLGARHQARGTTLSGPFAATRKAAPLTAVGQVEIPLPAHVRSVKVWQSGPAREAWMALAYRSGKPFDRSESDYLSLLEAVGQPRIFELFAKGLRALETSPAPHERSNPARVQTAGAETADLEADLENQWLPLMRRLRGKYLQFSADVEPPASGERTGPPLSESDLQVLRARASKATAGNDWHRALDAWGQVWRGSRGEARAQARMEQITALEQLGNAFLADRLLRGTFLHAKSPSLRRAAYARLLESRERAGNPDGVLTVVASMAIEDPSPAALRRLARALLDAGSSRGALQVLLALPEDARPAEPSLRAAYLQGWWRFFEQSLVQLEDETQRLLWMGYRAQLTGDYAAALEHWSRAGSAGETLHRHLIEGMTIRAELDSSDPNLRRRALERWQQWQARGMASGRYSGRPNAVRHSQGALLIHSRQLDLVSEGYVAGFARPLVVPVYGPTRLRVTARPLHPAGAGHEPINDWVNAWGGRDEESFPVVNNRPSPGLAVVGRPDLAIGRGVQFEYSVPAGYHEIRLEPEQHPVLVELALLEPELPVAILPPLTPYTAKAALDGNLGTRPPLAVGSGTGSKFVPFQQRCDEAPASKLPGDEISPLPQIASSTLELPAAPWFANTGTPARPLATDEQQATTTVQPLMQAPPADQARLESLRAWLRLADHDPSQRARALAEAEAEFAEDPTTPGAEAVMRRLRRSATWQRVRAVEQSAGVRAVQSASWEPEQPDLRVRKALMKPLEPGEQLVSGFNTLVLSVQNTRRARFRVHLRAEEVGHHRPQGMDVLVAVDDRPEQRVHLSSAEPRVTLVEELGRGQRTLRIRIAEPLSNQYLRVRFEETREGLSTPVAEPVERYYDVSTREEPLVVYAEGPARLRVDEYRSDGTRTRYRQLGPGSHRLEVPPPEHRDEALYRLYRQSLVDDRPRSAPRPLAVSFDTMQPPPLRLPEQASPPERGPSDTLPLGGQEDGSWSAYAAMVSRRTLNDEPDDAIDADRYFATGLGYRYFSERQQTYYESSLKVRLRDSGQPTLAFQQWVDVRRDDWPFDLDLAASLFVQDSEAAASLRGRMSRQWKWGEKTSTRPYASLFQRFLTLDDVSDSKAEPLDRDVFTDYKRDHRRGLTLGNLTVHRPRVDTMLHARVSVTSNEDLNPFDPDNVQLRLGSKQLLGDITLGTGYGLTHYLSDGDRERSETRSKFWLEAGYLGFWTPQDGGEATFRVEYDAKSDDTSYWLSFAWHRSNGRYYRDFRPSDVDFIALRKRRALEREAEPVILEGLEGL